MSKARQQSMGIVYSTDPSFKAEEINEEVETLENKKQGLLIIFETKHRAGKAVTLVTGFIGKQDDLESLGKKLKTACGTGGSVKDGQIIIQGDHRVKILEWLKRNNYLLAKLR